MKWLLSPNIVMFAAVISPDDGDDMPMRPFIFFQCSVR